MSECRNLENVGQVEELLLMTEQMQDELDQKDQTIQELNRQLSESLTLNEKLNSENRAENIEALRTRLRQTEERLTSETDSRKRADAEAVAWKFKYEKAEQEKLYAQTHQKTVEVAVEKKVPYEKCEKCDRTAYRKAKEKCDSRKSQLEKKYKNMTIGYESILFLLAWYICKFPSRYNLAYSNGSSIASDVKAQSDPGVVLKFFSASQQSIRSI